MKRDIEQFKNSTFDVLVIGGGITGACLAYDAALRGLKTALIEKKDFGGYTSAASSKLLHGGIRYLQQGRLDKVLESAVERAYFQNLAPHLTQYVPFAIPTYRSPLMKTRMVLRCGVSFYESLCRRPNRLIQNDLKKVPDNRVMTYQELIEAIPALKHDSTVTGAVVLFESHMVSSERMTLAFVKSAMKEGAQVANYLEAKQYIRDDNRVTGVEVMDRLSGQILNIQAQVVMNAAGPYIPELNQTGEGLHLKRDTTGYSKGVHLVTREIIPNYALGLASQSKSEALVSRGGRHFFLIPWRSCTLIGTTNVPYQEKLDNLKVTERDIQEFLDEINETLPSVQLKREDVRFAFAGLYPLTAKELRPDTYQGTGDYQIIDHSREDHVEGVLSVLGAKYTTARRVAEKTVNLLLKKLGMTPVPCRTTAQPLLHGNIPDLELFIKRRIELYKGQLDAEVILNLVAHYGEEVDLLLKKILENPAMQERPCRDRLTMRGEICHAVEQEMASTLEDVILRRTGIGTIGCPSPEELRRIASWMKDLLGWTEEKMEKEVAQVQSCFQYPDH